MQVESRAGGGPGLVQGQMALGFDISHGAQGYFSFKQHWFSVIFVFILSRVVKDIRNLTTQGA